MIASVRLICDFVRCRSNSDATPTSYWRWTNFRYSRYDSRVCSVIRISASAVEMLKYVAATPETISM